jgi:tricorn protease
MSKQSGYYRFPTINGQQVVFVCEDDLWSIPASGGVPVRLTANLGEVSHPFLSPSGHSLAFVGREEGHPEVYCMPAAGGTARRLTFLGANTSVVGWSPDGQFILFASNGGQPFGRIDNLYRISSEGGLPERLPMGLAHNISYGAAGEVVIGRNTSDPARWKRYRGGTAGVLWIAPDAGSTFQKLTNLEGNLATPMWVGERIFFISDSQGVGNLYSCTPSGTDLKQHTDSTEYYVRNASTDGRRIVYHTGADLFLFDPETGISSLIEIEFHSSQIQRQRKFVDCAEFLEDYDLHPEGHSVVVTTRGKSFALGNWEGAVTQISQSDGIRDRLTRWLNDKQRFVRISDRDGFEAIEICSADLNVQPERLQEIDLGRAIELEVSPVEDKVVLSNHRHELILVDLESKQSRILDRSDYERIEGFCWSPDGRWVAYSCAKTARSRSIHICNINDGKTYALTPPRFIDLRPAFDPDGKFIYFLSAREFNPVYDTIYFDLNFPRGMRPFLIALKKETVSPFVPIPKSLKAASSDKGAEIADVSDKPTVEIDFDGIESRIVGFPVAEGRYEQIWGLKGKVLFSSLPIQGSLDFDWISTEPEAEATLEVYSFDEQKQETITTHVTNFKVSRESETLIYRSKNRLRVCVIAPLEQGKSIESEPGRKSGWLDLQRIRVSVVPEQERQQMLHEIWRLQREHFWTADMSGVDWERAYYRYLPLLDRISTRSEFSDLVWELQGELGTSHAYEFGGDYRQAPDYKLGFLGADFAYDSATDAYRIAHIVTGDAWDEKADSPLHRLGSRIEVGDLLLAVGGQRVGLNCPPQALLVHQAGCEVSLTVENAGGNESRTVTVKTLADEMPARYREWVEANHLKVQEATAGRVGYLHIPDMLAQGYAEFHRYYLAEAQKEALIVDVRFNRGGHVSQLILEKLARTRIGYDVPRWGKPEPYPADSIWGSMVALTNEYAGSDGDMFSHAFKLMKLGSLIGQRTWGGVVGIWARHPLVDGSLTTQPEFGSWFTDVGWGVENYGTDPDIPVEISPSDWHQGKDPQLERGIEVALAQLDQDPVKLPKFDDRPHLPLPGLPCIEPI